MSREPVDLRIATFNIRNTNDRYEERRPLLEAAFRDLGADIVALQEVVFEPEDQDDMLAATVPDRVWRSVRSPASPRHSWGNAILSAFGEMQAHEILRLSDRRTAHAVLIALPGLRTLWFANTHLHHKPLEPEVRTAQVRAIIDWLDTLPAADATVVCGDFNMPPHEPGYALMTAAGFVSALFAANGEEPAVTWPSGIQAPTMDTDGDPNCLDYIWVRGGCQVVEAWVSADRPAPFDETLFPSDHFALVADIRLP